MFVWPFHRLFLIVFILRRGNSTIARGVASGTTHSLLGVATTRATAATRHTSHSLPIRSQRTAVLLWKSACCPSKTINTGDRSCFVSVFYIKCCCFSILVNSNKVLTLSEYAQAEQMFLIFLFTSDCWQNSELMSIFLYLLNVTV